MLILIDYMEKKEWFAIPSFRVKKEFEDESDSETLFLWLPKGRRNLIPVDYFQLKSQGFCDNINTRIF